eukprot:TRINITY_DN8089_c0_g1_i1.p1 TRINITY_DN8089_c0_g1~~TRINITY_DN8089_c0_g1_i1.p1  ORF type:complete len:88 (-),score=17.12 TRINITY_DN8089_c0_g1_i1:241-504(-)
MKELFESCADVNCIANLIKVWFRELPTQVLSVVTTQQIDEIADDPDQDIERIGILIKGFPEPIKSIFFWLLDVCVDVYKNDRTQPND